MMKLSALFFFSFGIFWSSPLWSVVFPAEPDMLRGLASEDSEPEIVPSAPAENPPDSLMEKNFWIAPNYGGQEQALGYASYGFKIPPGLEERVQFWTNIYSKHSSQGGVLHDSRYVHLVYTSLDFSDIWSQEGLSPLMKERMIDRRLKEEKKNIEERLIRMSKATSNFGFSEEDLKLWEMFRTIDEPNKFLEAARKGRLRFQQGQSDIFKNGIRQSGHYLRQMEQIFKEEGMPVELTRLVFVESSFNLKARSRVGASGIWQFMRATAKSYMRMDASVDERNDPLTATRAAARKLRQNYKMLEDWPLAVTGYNHGPYGIVRLAKKLNSKNIIDFVDFRKGSFGFASASFYASFLAALEVERRALEIYGPIEMGQPRIGSEFKLKKPLRIEKLIELYGGDEQRAKDMNPHILSVVWTKKLSVLAKNMVRLDKEAEVRAQSWPQMDQFMFSTRAI